MTTAAEEISGLTLPTRAEALDVHAGLVLRVAAARGHRHWMHWRFGDGRLLLRLRVGPAVFSYCAGALLRVPAATPNARGRHINGDAFDLVCSKHATKAALAARGFTTFPEGRRFAAADVAAAVAYAVTLGGPICVKPEFGTKGTNVAAGLTQPDEIRAAFQRAAGGPGGEAVVVERSLVGEVIRFFYTAPKIVGVRVSRPPSVVGDGVSTLTALIAAKNVERVRRGLPGHKPLVADADTIAHLARSGMTLASIPPAGATTMLRPQSNNSVGADSLNCGPDDLHPSHIALVEAICASLAPLQVAAVDTIVTDRAKPAGPDSFSVLEINNSPGFITFPYPWEGAPQDIAAALVDLMERVAAGETA